MFSRLNTVLFRPKMIGTLINDKFLKMFSFFAVLILITSFANLLQSTTFGLSNSMQLEIISELRKISLDEQLEIENYELKGNESFILNLSFINIYMNYDFEEIEYSNGYSLVFGKNGVNFIVSQRVYNSNFRTFDTFYTYEELNVNNLSINDATINYRNARSIVNVTDRFFKELVIFYLPYLFILNVIEIVGFFLFSVLAIYILSRRENPIVTKQFRKKIIFYSATWSIIFSLFSILYGIGILVYVGLSISYIFALKALNSIVKIKYRKE